MKDAWLEAIKDDQLPWTHVSDLKYKDSEILRLYNVHSIPQSVLVDQNGNIIKRKPSHEELEEILKEYLK